MNTTKEWPYVLCINEDLGEAGIVKGEIHESQQWYINKINLEQHQGIPRVASHLQTPKSGGRGRRIQSLLGLHNELIFKTNQKEKGEMSWQVTHWFYLFLTIYSTASVFQGCPPRSCGKLLSSVKCYKVTICHNSTVHKHGPDWEQISSYGIAQDIGLLSLS